MPGHSVGNRYKLQMLGYWGKGGLSSACSYSFTSMQLLAAEAYEVFKFCWEGMWSLVWCVVGDNMPVCPGAPCACELSALTAGVELPGATPAVCRMAGSWSSWHPAPAMAPLKMFL